MATRIRSKSTSGKSVTHARKPPPPTFRTICANSQYPSLHWQGTAPPAQPLKNDCYLDTTG